MRSFVFRSAALVAVIVACLALSALAAGLSDLQIQSTTPGTSVEVERVLGGGKVVVRAVDAENKPLFGLGVSDFGITQAGRTAKIVSVEPLSQSQDVPRHIVMVLDNSFSMKERKAIKPLLEGVREVLKTVRPIDDVQMVVFISASAKPVNMGGRNLHVQTFKSNQPAALQDFTNKAYHEGLTDTTVLYEGMLAGLDLIKKTPDTGPKIMVVFSDGEDVNSAFTREDVLKAAKGVGRLNAFAIDYMPGPQTDKFLTAFATQNRGQILKAEGESKLVPIFQSVASKMSYFYVINYAFPITGKLAVVPDTVTIEEVKTIDSSPLLGHIYFAEGSSKISSPYVLLAGPGETAGFDEQKFRDTLEKYYQVLNIIGKRLTDKPEATITLVGCNSDTGKEKGKKKLSTQRAEVVKNYLQTVWNIDPKRMSIEARNLPGMPSVSRLKEGQAENRRVEIRSTDMAIMAPIRSTYLATWIDTPVLKLRPSEIAQREVASWKLTATNSSGKLSELEGKGAPGQEVQVPLPTKDLQALAAGGDITLNVEAKDNKGQNVVLNPILVKVNFIQTSQRLAQKEGQKVQEKYALILFDYNKDTISALNQEIVKRVAARIKELPKATAEVVGHTDNIGKEAYNLKLSERRALAVYKQLAAAYGKDAKEHIHYKGVGPKSPLYDNTTPEARSFNRTVTITMDYLSAE